MDFHFRGKTALITGATEGLGRAVATTFAKHGANLALLDIKFDGLKQLQEELRQYDVQVSVWQCDVSDEERVNTVCEEALQQFGSIEILVNNAGLWRNSFCEFANASSKDWRRKIDVNILGTMYVTRALINNMIDRRYGRIINIGSVAGVYGIRTMTDYSMTKGAIISFTQALAKEVIPMGITVNCVSPGTVHYTPDPCDKCYAGRYATYEEDADLILFLASDHAAYIAGQNYIIDGSRKMI